MNPRLSMNVMTTQDWDLGRCVDAYARLGIPAIGVTHYAIESYGRDRGTRKIKDAGLKVSSSTGAGPFTTADRAMFRKNIEKSIAAMDVAAGLGADCLYVMTGPRGEMPWEAAAQRFAEGLERLVPEARQRGVRLAVEPVHPLRQDLTFINTARDAAEVIAPFDPSLVGYVFDFWHCWWERGVEATIARSGKRIFAAQPSDHKALTKRTMDRAMLGKGVIPLAELLAAVEKAGYRGYYDIEIISDDLAAMGYDSALKQTIADFDALWERAGA